MVVGQVGRDAGWVLFWVPKGITKTKAPQIKTFKEVYRYDAMSFIGDAALLVDRHKIKNRIFAYFCNLHLGNGVT